LASKIEYLEIISEPYQNPPTLDVLDALIIPAVSELRINNFRFSLPSSKFLSLISRSACTLRRLALLDCSSFKHLQLCLQAVPSVTDFEFCHLGMKDAPGHPSNMNSRCLLPNLRTLTLKEVDFDLPALASMLSSRWRDDAVYPIDNNGNYIVRLESAAVSFGLRVRVGTLVTASRQLRHLASEGMKITLTEAGVSLRL
jgi:hypothetical protein